MFLVQVRSSRNITTYVPQLDQVAEEHKVGPYIPRPGPRNISAQFVNPAWTSPFFHSSPLSPRSCALAPSSPRTGHPGSPLPTHQPPWLCPHTFLMRFLGILLPDPQISESILISCGVDNNYVLAQNYRKLIPKICKFVSMEHCWQHIPIINQCDLSNLIRKVWCMIRGIHGSHNN
jgi:hypothetical protein